MSERQNYDEPLLDKVAEMMATGEIKRGRVTHVTVLHDDWCNVLKGKTPCNCNPEIVRGKPDDNRN